jgi:hypothetical protein
MYGGPITAGLCMRVTPRNESREVRDLKRCLLAMLFMALMLLATAAQAFAGAGGTLPALGGSPPGYSSRDSDAGDNPSTDDRTRPRTGGIKYNECGDYNPSLGNQPAGFCEQP